MARVLIYSSSPPVFCWCLYQKSDCSRKYLKGHSSVYTLPEYISICMKAFAAHNWSRELQWQIPWSHNIPAMSAAFPTWQSGTRGGWKTGLDVQNGKNHCRNLVASGCQWHLPLWATPDCFMGNSKGWAQDTLGVWMRKPSVEGSRNPAVELERIFQREETTEGKRTVGRQWQGQSWMDRAPSTDTGEGATKWGVHQGPSHSQQCPGIP